MIPIGILTAAASTGGFLLDQFPNATAAYSLRKLRGGYTGSAIRVRRSNDNAETNIGFNAGNELDTTALTTFVGANNGFITIWYDQSGNARDAIQTTNSLQPIISVAGTITYINGKPTIENLATNYLLTTQTGFNNLQTHSDFLVTKWKSVTQGQDFNGYVTFAPLTGNDFDQNTSFTINLGNSLLSQSAAVQGLSYSITSSNTATLAQKLICHIINSNAGVLYTNNFLNGSATGVFLTTNTGKLYIGCRFISGSPSTTYTFRGYFQEIITWNDNKTTDRIAIQNNINSFYSIY